MVIQAEVQTLNLLIHLPSFSIFNEEKFQLNQIIIFYYFNIIFTFITVENETRCFGDIGCMNITREWYHLINRPFNVFPLPRSVINTRFILYTEKNPTEGQILVAEDKDGIKESNFNSKWMTKFIIHGFIDTPLSNWVSELRDELIARTGLNVIVVDWAGGSLPLYTQVCFVLQIFFYILLVFFVKID